MFAIPEQVAVRFPLGCIPLLIGCHDSIKLIIGTTSIVLRRIEAPIIVHTNSLKEILSNIQNSRHDVCFAIPLFGGNDCDSFKQMLRHSVAETGLSARAHDKILRVAAGSLMCRATIASMKLSSPKRVTAEAQPETYGCKTAGARKRKHGPGDSLLRRSQCRLINGVALQGEDTHDDWTLHDEGSIVRHTHCFLASIDDAALSSRSAEDIQSEIEFRLFMT